MYVIKRNGEQEEYDVTKVNRVIRLANGDVGNVLDDEQIDRCVRRVDREIKRKGYAQNVEEIQDLVEHSLMKEDPYVARAYYKWRMERELKRNNKRLLDQARAICNHKSEEANQENANKDTTILSTQRDYLAGIISKEISREDIDPEIIAAHDEGVIHNHDMDYQCQEMTNCCLVNVKDQIENGTILSKVMIEPPERFSTGCTIVTQIILQVSGSQYGGQTFSLAHLIPLVERTRRKFYDLLRDVVSEDEIDATVEKLVNDDIRKGVRTLQYQMITLASSNGQAPFVSMYMNIDDCEGTEQEDMALVMKCILEERMRGVKNEQGVYVPVSFPKLLYVTTESNIRKDSRYFWLTQLAAKCTDKTLVPDYISSKKMKEVKGDVFGCMGCRSFLSPDPINHKYWGRFNQGVCTINIPYVALESKGDEEKFWSLMDKYTELCHRALLYKHENLEGTLSDVAPILWQGGSLARLKPGEKIDTLLHNGYSTISLGYAGICEAVRYMRGVSHTDQEGREFAIKILEYLNARCDEWNKEHNIGFSVYGTPLESTTYKFAKALKKFDLCEGVNDHDYITNSYHVNVREEIDAFTKIKLESQFQELSSGGSVSYIEAPNMNPNPEATVALIQYFHDTIMYAEINSKPERCNVCGFEGEISLIRNNNGKIIWHCPQCGNEDHTKMNTFRRICGYCGVNDANQGRLSEIADRVLHI